MAKYMEVAFRNGIMAVDRETDMVNLNELIVVGNKYREESGMNPVDMQDYLRRRETWEFINVLDSKSPESGELKVDQSGQIAYTELIKSTDLITSKRGRYGGTYGDVYIAIDVAAWINPEFKYEVYKTFVESKIVGIRNSGVDKVRELTSLMQDRFADINTHDYVTINMAINRKVNGVYVKGWDHHMADADKQKARLDLITACCTLVDGGFIDNVTALTSYIDRHRSSSRK